MKNIFKTVAVIVLLTLAAIGCVKENEITPVVKSTTVHYNAGNQQGDITLANDDAWDDFLDRMLALAREGYEVTLTSGTVSKLAAKDVVTYSTTSEAEAKKWIKAKVLQGYEVLVTYDDETGIYSCSASKSIYDPVAIDSTIPVDTFYAYDSVNSDNWVERWVFREDLDTTFLAHIFFKPGVQPVLPPNPAWIEVWLTRYDEDSVLLGSRIMAQPTREYIRSAYNYGRILELNDIAWHYYCFPNGPFSISQDTLKITNRLNVRSGSRSSWYEQTFIHYYHIGERTDTSISIKPLWYEWHNFELITDTYYYIDTTIYADSLATYMKFRIYKQ